MALTVATNTGALMAQAAASSVNKEMQVSMERLSTGKRINGASDDAAGVAIASRLTSEIRGTNQAIRNAMDGQAMIDTAEGAHVEIESLLQRMREISVQSSNDTNNATDRANLQSELNALTDEINRISTVTTWAGQNLLTGLGGNNGDGTFKIQVGSQTSASDLITATIGSMSAASLGVGSGNAVASATAASISAIGGNVIQVAGEAVSGDVFNFDLNGDTFAITIGAINASGDIAYTFTQKTGTTSVDSSGGTFDTGNAAAILGDTASVIAAVLNEAASGGGMNGMTATAAADGSVTITQSSTVTAANYNDGASADSGDGVVSVNGNTTTIKFPSGGLSGLAATDEFNFTIEGTTVTFTDTAADQYDGTDLTAYVAGLQAQVDASTGLKGYTVSVNSGGGDDLIIDITRSTTLGSLSTSNAAGTSALDITSSSSARTAIGLLDTAIQSVNSQRASLGAVSNRLDNTVSNLTNISNNLAAGRGRIEDADFAAETTSLAKSQILQQASTAMLAQANASKQNVLSLLQG